MTRAAALRNLRRLVLMVGGEAMQSALNFALNLALLHLLSAEDYGIFAIVMVIGGLGLTYVRSLTAMPASIWIGRSRTSYAARAFEVTFGSVAVVFAALMGAGVGVLLHVWLGQGAIAGGCFVGLWALRSHLRTTFFALGRLRVVSLGDLTFTLCGAAFAAVAIWVRAPLLEHILLAMALANAAGLATLLALAGQPIRVSLRRSVRQRFRALWRQLGWSLVSVTMTNLQGQAIALLVASVAGPAAYAPIAAVLVLFVPLRVAATAFVNMIQPELAALLARGAPDRVWRLCKGWSLVMGIGGVAYGALMLLLLPHIRWQALQGTDVTLIGAFAWTIYSVTMLYVMPRVVLEVQLAFRTVAYITGAGAVVGAVMIRLILAFASAPLALAGGAFSEVVVLVASWAIARRRLMAMPRADTDDRPIARAASPHPVLRVST